MTAARVKGDAPKRRRRGSGKAIIVEDHAGLGFGEWSLDADRAVLAHRDGGLEVDLQRLRYGADLYDVIAEASTRNVPDVAGLVAGITAVFTRTVTARPGPVQAPEVAVLARLTAAGQRPSLPAVVRYVKPVTLRAFEGLTPDQQRVAAEMMNDLIRMED